jgi:hypothetical protein
MQFALTSSPTLLTKTKQISTTTLSCGANTTETQSTNTKTSRGRRRLDQKHEHLNEHNKDARHVRNVRERRHDAVHTVQRRLAL